MDLPASISGTVASDTSRATDLKGICVSAQTNGETAAATTTNATGRYELKRLYPGTYDVEFVDCRQNLYLAQYYDDKTIAGSDGVEASPTPLDVAVGRHVDGIDASLEVGGQFAGTVTNTPSNDEKPVALSGICVEAAPVMDVNDPDYDPPYEYAVTSTSGHYRLKGLWDWSYLVTFNECAPVDSAYGGASDRSNPVSAIIGVTFHLGTTELPS